MFPIEIIRYKFKIKYKYLSMLEKDRKEFKEKQQILLLESFQNEAKLENIKKVYIDNSKLGATVYIHPIVDSVKKCLKSKKDTA